MLIYSNMTLSTKIQKFSPTPTSLQPYEVLTMPRGREKREREREKRERERERRERHLDSPLDNEWPAL